MKTRNKGIRTIRVADIIDNPDNFRSHPEDQKKAFAATVEAIGFYGYPDVYECDGGLRLIDGEQLNRRCYGMEISPAYCAVILQRMTDAGCSCKLEA